VSVPDGFAAAIEQAAPLTARFREAGRSLFFVGGVVRDHWLDRSRPENDLDATTDARPEEIKALVANLAEAVWTQGERFGTIGCTIDGQMYEITTHRAEAYDPESRKPTVSFGDRIEDDLARRDFTVNAMAVDLLTGDMVDPHHGRADLAARILRTPLDPEISFSEDPLRMLRAARFHSGYDLVPTPELVEAMTALVPRIEIVSSERIRDEIQKLILLDTPSNGLALLAQTGLLAAVLPSLSDYSPDDARLRGEMVAQVAPTPAARWAALLAPEGIDLATLRRLKFSGSLTTGVIWLASSYPWVVAPGTWLTDAPALRRTAALTPTARTLDELYGWVGGLRSAAALDHDDVDAHRLAYESLLAVEPDLGDPLPLLTGEAVCAVLGIEPGRAVGVAMRWLRDLRLDEGPVDVVEAADRLLAWWPTRPLPESLDKND
jgi:poly(A) polymerase